MDPLVSIVCACRNEAGNIGLFLQSLTDQQTNGFEFEVIIADGVSEDGTRDSLELYARAHSGVRVIDNPDRIVATGLNRAIRLARGQVIVRMDAHTEYANDYVRRCVEVLNETGADNVGGAPRVRSDDFRMRVFGAAFHSAFACGGAKSHDASYEGYVDSVSFGCWRKSTLESLGLFDETLVRNQDDELNFRLIRSGGKIWQSAKIVSWYQPRRKLGSLVRQYFGYGFWKVAVVRKHRKPASWRHLAPGTFMAANLMLATSLTIALLLHSTDWVLWVTNTWLTVISVYVMACIIASVIAARSAGWRIGFLLPPIFAIYHFSYGAGFLAGLIASIGKLSR